MSRCSNDHVRSTKHDFDSLRVEIVGFIRTQLVAAAATLRLAEHLRDGGLQAEDFAARTGLDPTIAFRFLRACTKIGLVTCRDGRLFHATSRLRVLDGDTPGSLRHLAMLFGTPSQFLLQTALAAALSSPAERNAKGLGAPYSTTTPSIRSWRCGSPGPWAGPRRSWSPSLRRLISGR